MRQQNTTNMNTATDISPRLIAFAAAVIVAWAYAMMALADIAMHGPCS